jgi:lysophospholipase L1-like esterase
MPQPARKEAPISPMRPIHPVVAAILGTALFLVAAEIVVRLWLVSPSIAVPDLRYSWVIQPHARIVNSAEGWSSTHTNSMGLLDDELRVPRARVRAILLGDSFTEALQVPRRDNFGQVAERSVSGLEVVNVGYSGRSPVEYADWLDEYGPRLTPDIVVVQLNDGDLGDLLLPAAQARLAADTAPPAGAPPEGRFARLLRRGLRNSALATVTWRRLKQLVIDERKQLAKRFHGTAVAAVGSAPPTFAADPRLPALMDTLHRRIAAHSPRLVYLYIPSVDYFGPRLGYGEPEVAAFYHAFAARNRVTLVDPIEQFRAEFARTGQPLHGFSNSVMGSGHLNAAGHRVVGERLARAIAEATR